SHIIGVEFTPGPFGKKRSWRPFEFSRKTKEWALRVRIDGELVMAGFPYAPCYISVRDFAGQEWVALRMRVLHTPTRLHQPAAKAACKWVALRMRVIH